MQRLILSFTFIMVMAIAGILFFQWNGFLSGSAKESVHSKVNQSFTIHHDGNGFFITQEVQFLSDKQEEMTIEWPENASNYQCLDESRNDCLSKENGEFYLKVKSEGNQKLTISYKLKRQTADGYLLLSEWYPVLTTGIPVKTSINIIEKTNRDAVWISGYKEWKHEAMDFIDYYSFVGYGSPSDLLLYPGKVNSYEGRKVRVYSDEKLTYKIMNTEYSDAGFVTVVIDDRLPVHEAENFLIIGRNFQQSTLMLKVKWGLNQQKYTSSYQESWLKELKASLILQSPHGSPKALRVYQELKNGLTEDQFASFSRLLKNDKSPLIHSQKMDALLMKATNLTTSFISEITTHTKKEIPLVLRASQNILLNGKPLEDGAFIQYHQNELISFTELLKGAGIEVKYLQEGVIYVTDGGHSYRFYIDKDYFILNEESYGLLTKPVQKIGSTVYMDVKWLEKLFHIEIDKTSSAIKIQTKET
ncbi:hypothetical protein [Bacillus sp. Marseille-Q1617]|uniref:hypothetical protein n=1 Tax=Bacillus sp. Marseille-Q1617 TaxID=2736887 RepID=UPI00158C58AB|nr:hypothetical protein [Bacillus sp. Marseille-Q1617]